MIYTVDQIEKQARKVKGTWIKRRNLRRRLGKESNQTVTAEIGKLRKVVRTKKAEGAKESELRSIYAQITHLELSFIEIF